MIMPIFLAQFLYRKNLNTQTSLPVLEIIMQLAALIFVDDANFHVLNSGLDTAGKVIIKT